MSCPHCYVGLCKKHKMQDHGRREKLLLASKQDLQKKLFETLVKPQAEKLQAQSRGTSAKELDRYREEVEKDREQAMKRKSKYTEEEIAMMQKSGLRGDVLVHMIKASKDEKEKSKKKKKKKEKKERKEEKKRKKKRSKKKKKEKEKERSKDKKRKRSSSSDESSSSESSSDSSDSSDDDADDDSVSGASSSGAESRKDRKKKKRRSERESGGEDSERDGEGSKKGSPSKKLETINEERDSANEGDEKVHEAGGANGNGAAEEDVMAVEATEST